MECEGNKKEKFDPKRELTPLEEMEKRRKCELRERERMGTTRREEANKLKIELGGLTFGIFFHFTISTLVLSSCLAKTTVLFNTRNFRAGIPPLPSVNFECHPRRVF